MKSIKFVVTILFLALLLFGCENINEPIDIEEGSVPAFVIIETEDQDVVAGSSLDITFQLGQTQEENVNVTYSISGSATEGVDYTISDGSGSITIEHDPDDTSFDRADITLSTPIDAAFGSSETFTVTLESAVTESGEELTVGRGGEGIERTYTINGLGDVEEGTYEYEATGAFGPFSGTFEVEQPEDPVVVGGNPYLFTTSNIAGTLFGQDVAYAFNVTADGSVLGAPNAHVEGFETVVLDVTGSYDSESQNLIFNVTMQCCGVDGAAYQIDATLQ